MKIGIIAHNAFAISEPYAGGLEMITRLLILELHKRGHSLCTLCRRGSDLPGNMLYYETHGDPSEAETAEKAVEDFYAYDFDIVHNNSLDIPGIVMGEQGRMPYISSFHTPIFDNINTAIGRVKYPHYQTFTAVSKSLANTYQEKLPKVEAIYNGIEVEKWKYDFTPQNYFSWVGRVCPEKGLVETIQNCVSNNIQLRFAGPISNKAYYEEKVSPLVEKYTNIEYVGHLTQDKVNLLIGKSQAFIFSSTWEEPYGLVLAEALASGVAVLASKVGAASEIIDNTCGRLYDISDPKTFSEALAEIPKVSRKDCRTRAEDFCSHRHMVNAYENLYTSLV